MDCDMVEELTGCWEMMVGEPWGGVSSMGADFWGAWMVGILKG